MKSEADLKDVFEMWRLNRKGYSHETISRVTGSNKRTVIKYLSRYGSKELTDFALASAFHDYSVLDKGLKEKLEELLQLEKERRGVSRDKLVFVGMANIAKYRWCAMKSLLESRGNELLFFRAYVDGRLDYSFRLRELKGLDTGELPRDPLELLSIGDEITFDDIERLLKLSEEEGKKDGIIQLIPTPEFPELSREEQLRLLQQLPPTERGEFLQSMVAEKYPTIRWDFRWKNYTIIGAPDGITRTFVYEFKTSKDKFLASFIRPVALMQADLYGYFFKRRKKRVQIYTMNEDAVETLEDDVDRARVKEMLNKFKSIDEGDEKPLPPKEWKCKTCEFKAECPLIRD